MRSFGCCEIESHFLLVALTTLFCHLTLVSTEKKKETIRSLTTLILLVRDDMQKRYISIISLLKMIREQNISDLDNIGAYNS